MNPQAPVCRKEGMPLWIKIVLSIIVIEALGGLGAMVTSSEIPNWYASLEKPPGTPPNWLFGPVWITLYALMGTAFGLVWHSRNVGAVQRAALGWFAVQFVLNLAWTPIFFGMHQMLLALLVIVALWVAILMTIRCFRKAHSWASWLLVPYLVWVSYATYLNVGYWWLNR